MKSFMKFCKDRVTDTPLTVTAAEIPDKYKKIVNSTIQIMKNKKDIFDSINIPFVEGVFVDGFEKILEDKLDDGEIPDGIVHNLSTGIFGEYPVNLTKEQTAIIKILSVYICIQS